MKELNKDSRREIQTLFERRKQRYKDMVVVGCYSGMVDVIAHQGAVRIIFSRSSSKFNVYKIKNACYVTEDLIQIIIGISSILNNKQSWQHKRKTKNN